MIGSTHYVSTEEELLDWADALTNNTSLNCVLLDDITLTEDWIAIGEYSGTFDGKGHTISDVVIESGPGFFNKIKEGATIKNLTLEVGFAESNTDETGAGAFAFSNSGTIKNCHAIINSNISVTANLGGIVGRNEVNGRIEGCSSIIRGKMSANSFVGGISGWNDGTIYASSAILDNGGSVSSYASNYGGITASNSGTISASSAIHNNGGSVSSSYYGGIAASNNGTISASFAILDEGGKVSSDISFYGGITANNSDNSVIGCYAVINETIPRGFSYAIADSGNITACYWQSSDEKFVPSDNDKPNVTEVTATEEWADAMDAMNAAITDTGYQFEKNTGTDAGTIPLIIVPSST